MKTTVFERSTKMGLSIRIILLIAISIVFFANNLMAKTAKEIDVSVDVAIERF